MTMLQMKAMTNPCLFYNFNKNQRNETKIFSREYDSFIKDDKLSRNKS